MDKYDYVKSLVSDIENNLYSTTISNQISNIAEHISKYHSELSPSTDSEINLRKHLNISENALLLITSNHSSATLAPWQITRITFNEILAEYLTNLGYSAVSLVTPLEHNVISEPNKPPYIHINGRRYKLPEFSNKRANCPVFLVPNISSIKEINLKIQNDLKHDCALMKKFRNHTGLSQIQENQKDFENCFNSKLTSVEKALHSMMNGNNASESFNFVTAHFLKTVNFKHSKIISIRDIEINSADFYVQIAKKSKILKNLLQNLHKKLLGQGFITTGLENWQTRGFYHVICPHCLDDFDYTRMQNTTIDDQNPPNHTVICKNCSRKIKLSPDELMEQIHQGYVHPTVIPLYLTYIYHLRQALHTGGPQMSFYESVVRDIGKDFFGYSQNYWYQHIGNASCFVSLTPSFLTSIPLVKQIKKRYHVHDNHHLLALVIRFLLEYHSMDILEQEFRHILSNAGLGSKETLSKPKNLECILRKLGEWDYLNTLITETEKTHPHGKYDEIHPSRIRCKTKQKRTISMESNGKSPQRYNCDYELSFQLLTGFLMNSLDSFHMRSSYDCLFNGLNYPDLKQFMSGKTFGDLWNVSKNPTVDMTGENDFLIKK